MDVDFLMMMSAYMLHNSWHRLLCFVFDLITSLLKFNWCSWLHTIESDLLHSPDPAKMFCLNIDIQSHLWYSCEIKCTICGCSRMSFKAIFNLSDTCPYHLDIKISTVFLPEADNLATSGYISLVDYQIIHSFMDNKGHFASITTIVPRHPYFLFFR